MTEEQNAGKIFLFCKEPSPERIMKCLRDAFDVPGSVHDADLKLHNGDLDVTIRVYCEAAKNRSLSVAGQTGRVGIFPELRLPRWM